jgi:hypothetical protein
VIALIYGVITINSQANGLEIEHNYEIETFTSNSHE